VLLETLHFAGEQQSTIHVATTAQANERSTLAQRSVLRLPQQRQLQQIVARPANKELNASVCAT
jgi:hypothetical protein